MLKRTDALVQFEADYVRETTSRRSFGEALALFEGLWAEACAINPDFPTDWRHDLEPDLAIARILNELPPGP